MARDRDVRESSSRHYHDQDEADERERRHRRRHSHHSHHHHHRHRDYDYDEEDEYAAARRERRERRRAEEARREAELDLDDHRARRESYYPRAETDSYYHREPRRMAQDLGAREKEKSRSPRGVRRDGTVRRKKRREREIIPDDRSEDYGYGRPKSGVVEEVTMRRSTRRRSDEGGSSSRTAHTPLSGSRSASTRKEDPPMVSRSMSAREPPRGYATRPSARRSGSIKQPAITTAAPITRTQSLSVKDPARRGGGGLLASFFRAPPRASTQTLPKEVPRVECLVCMTDDLPAHKTAKLGCGHRMCHTCLRRQFILSVNDPQHMPPTCCSAEHIPLKYVERLFDDKFKKTWNKKYQEYTTANRLYCPAKGCGEWIKPSRIRMDPTYRMKYARCGRCNTKVCVMCNNKFHTRRECPKDEDTNRLVEMAKEQGWQRCYNCKAVVELKEGCNHMTCRCTAQFCMVCAAPWKTCSCPWFNYSHIEDGDRLNDMQIPYTAREDIIEVIEYPSDAMPPPLVRRSASTRTRHRPDRDLDRADEALAAHLQAQLRLDNRTVSDLHRHDPNVQVYGVGNSGDHHMNESYTIRPLATAAARTANRGAPRTPAPRASFFSRRLSREPARPAPPSVVPSAKASTMAGLSRDGTKRGANRVGTWLNHVEVDEVAVHTVPRGVEVDHWTVEGSMVGID